jgi:transcriptional regulator with XRE-family HTH domain
VDKLRLANRIKTERGNRGISQKQLSELTGINNTVLSRIENGKKDISVENLVKIAQVFEVDIGYLLFDYIADNGDALSENILKQVSGLDPPRKKLFTDIMVILLENSRSWTDELTLRKPSQTVNYTEIGKRIRHERRKQGKTQEKLSEDVGVTASFLSALEVGRETTSLDTLFRIAHALNVPMSRLLINADNYEPDKTLYDVLEGLSHTGDRQDGVLLSLIAILVDNSDKW